MTIRKSLACSLLALTACAGGAQQAMEKAQKNPAPQSSAPRISDAELDKMALEALPPAPAGFTWVRVRNAFVLKPEGWHAHKVPDRMSGSTPVIGAWAISPEEFSETQQFETGFTVQVIPNSKAMYGVDAHTAALAYLRPFVDAHKNPEDVLIFDQKQNGPFEQLFFRYRDAPAGKTPIIVHKFLTVNPARNTVNAFTFESPEAKWQENWDKFGTPILQKVMVSPILPATE